MLIVIPICHLEIMQASRLAKWMHTLGGLENARCIVVHTWKASWDTEPIIANLKTTFGNVDVFLPPTEDESGWPISSNTMFQQTALYLEEQGNPDPWFWWECDVCPLIPGWYDSLVREYKLAEMPYMGSINQSMFLYIKGPRKGEKIIKGKHMVGAGIYPADFWQRCAGVRTLNELAFDVQLGPEIEPYCYDTPLLTHRWQTKNYRRNNTGQITMDDVDPTENHYGGRVIPPEANIIHGAKDLSLIDLLENERRLTRP